MATERLTGGCACGAVRYTIQAAPLFSFHCHCRQCQRAVGAGHSSQFGAPSEAVTLAGELRYHAQTADSGTIVRRGFCPTCGSPVRAINDSRPDYRFIHAASLDEPTQFVPTFSVWVSARQPWDVVDETLPSS